MNDGEMWDTGMVIRVRILLWYFCERMKVKRKGML